MVSVDRDAPVLCIHELEINASPDQVWAVFIDVAGWVDWMEPITAARLDGPLASGSIIHWSVAGVDMSVSEIDIPSKIAEVEPGRRLAWTGDAGGLTGTHVWDFEPSGTGTRLTNSESIFGAEDPAQVTKELGVFLQLWNARLKATVEQRYGGADS
ncbi:MULTISPECIES: SRPBCC family protein [Sphingobium]|uniref:SRPBCC family protein n=1 Tax=Sphingobium TaxID=165695 RepID=UPI00159C064B|nr:SRPBCC family protein [Sphingobium sp. 15-1]